MLSMFLALKIYLSPFLRLHPPVLLRRKFSFESFRTCAAATTARARATAAAAAASEASLRYLRSFPKLTPTRGLSFFQPISQLLVVPPQVKIFIFNFINANKNNFWFLTKFFLVQLLGFGRSFTQGTIISKRKKPNCQKYFSSNLVKKTFPQCQLAGLTSNAVPHMLHNRPIAHSTKS